MVPAIPLVYTKHQKLLTDIQEKATSMGFDFKPSKCSTLSIVSGKPQEKPVYLKSTSGNITTPVLVNSVITHPHKFLGSAITPTCSPQDYFKVMKSKMEEKLSNIDNAKCRGEYKLAVYERYALPSMRYHLSVHNLHKVHLESLDMLVKTYIKKWLNIPSRGVSDIGLFHPYMLNIKQPSTMYMEGHAGNHLSMKMKGDIVVNAALQSQVSREAQWSRKSSTAAACENMIATCVENDLFLIPTQENTWNVTSSVIHEMPKAKKAIKQSINQEVLDTWNKKVHKLTVQGEFTKLLIEEEESVTWQSLIRGMPRNIMAFSMRLATDSLASPSNLKRWGKRVLATCPLCSCPQGTLAHIINFCPVALKQGRMTWRHNSVLNFMFNVIRKEAPTDVEMYSDLPGKMVNNTVIPCDILVTTGIGSKPDLVILSRKSKQIALFELTCPLERNLHKANTYKNDKYDGMKTDLEAKGWKVFLVPFEVSSRGQILKHTQISIHTTLKHFNVRIPTHYKFIQSMSKISLLCTFSIFHAYQTKEWVDPAFLRP